MQAQPERVTGLVPQQICADWLALIERRYSTLDRDDPDFSLHSSSLRLRAVDGLTIDEVLRHLDRDLLGTLTACDVDQCWVRRQYAPHRAPPHHAPHSWHQDGALSFDFATHAGKPPPGDALLEMLTCWIPLTPCGIDAPGLEFVVAPLTHLLAPHELMPTQVAARYPASAFERPALNPGDALLLPGGTLHRTHVTPSMTHDRTSIELRFFKPQPLPERLRGDRFVCALRG
ncbi:MAG TPA: phytanoyl-CoA dioxygenase family protein [Albitalea sp.]|nr:phytanoyl-CoA dioxygenase family protein [Albitalea sp.]